MSKSTQRNNRKRRDAVGYDPDTPRCANCEHHRKPFWAAPVVTPTETFTVYQIARCSLGDFPNSPNGLCDKWTGLDGSTLKGETQ